MTYRQNLGNFGEDIACDFLIKNKYKIIERNFRKPWGEIDIICKAPDKTLVFVEVKTLRQMASTELSRMSSGQAPEEQLSPEDQLTKSKLLKIQKTALLYAGHFPEKISNEKGWRIDLIAITFSHEEHSIKHYQNI
ncbi:MAG: YraN family protein [Candidatus Paceibacterota bacterium]|jgi:putative endonuclease